MNTMINFKDKQLNIIVQAERDAQWFNCQRFKIDNCIDNTQHTE